METKEIRKNLKKELGYNARQVSISNRGSQIIFTIRDEKVDSKKVKNFSTSFESISRDYATGCILRGGNTFVSVTHSDDVRKSMIEKHIESVEAAAAKVKDNSLEHVEGTNYMVGLCSWGGGLSVWSNAGEHGHHVSDANDPRTAAFIIARNDQ